MRTPSLATLKSWSSKKFFIGTSSLEAATIRVIDRMNSSSTTPYYSDNTRSRGRPSQQNLSTFASSTAQRGSASQPICSLDPADPDAGLTQPESNQEVLQLKQTVLSMQGQLNNIVNSLQVLNTSRVNAAALPVNEQLVQAVVQLDAVRRHLMLRMDNEMVLVKQSNSTSKQHEVPSAMDAQRILARLSNIEELLKKLSFNPD